ncbi:MAG: Glu-tRNA(Gln) amidotransferase subunit GatD [Thaumarchaeota archaeon]|jgi:glutamyl-tRNA(Gln) amidotransferase subunit D|nr:Glu-tRNA(Gln) amidotransferase subunit GatD [Nitrososphaerota archaeon]
MEKLQEFSRIKFRINDVVYEGIVMPRTLYEDEDHFTIKLNNGYNIGVEKGKIEILEVEPPKVSSEQPYEKSFESTGPKILILGTGGTISSKVDYRTGAVKPAFTASQIVDMVPELKNLASISVKTIMNELSENMQPLNWTLMAREVYNAFKEGYEGIVIAHGTDTMHYSASALSFAIENPAGPVVFVGSQRSSDRPSSDAATNLLGAVIFAAKSNSPGVYVAMHASINDDLIAIHKGVKVRKNHTSRRDAFKSINAKPFAYVDVKKLEIKFSEKKTEAKGPMNLYEKFSERAALLKFYPGISDKLLSSFFNKEFFDAVIVEGTGLGHVSRKAFPYIKDYIEKGGFVGMTSQCIWGSVRLTVYETGRDLLSMGVVSLEDMLSEVALVKSMWAIGNGLDLKAIMPKNLRGEINERREVL